MNPVLGIASLVDIDVHTKSEANSRDHWQKRADRVAAQRRTTRASLSMYERPALPVRVTLRRFSVNELDDDNLRSAFKAVRDEVAAWLGVDDRDRNVMWTYTQDKASRGAHRIEVEFHSIRKPTSNPGSIRA